MAFGCVVRYPSTPASSRTRRQRAERHWPSGADCCDTITEFQRCQSPRAFLCVDGRRDKPFNGSHGTASAEDLPRLP